MKEARILEIEQTCNDLTALWGPGDDGIATIRELIAEVRALREACARPIAAGMVDGLLEGHHKEHHERESRLSGTLRKLVVEVDFVLSGGDNPSDQCTECGLAGIGMLRDARRDALELLKEIVR